MIYDRTRPIQVDICANLQLCVNAKGSNEGEIITLVEWGFLFSLRNTDVKIYCML